MAVEPRPPLVQGRPVRGLRRAEYDRLVATGAFVDERVELIRGVIIEMPPQGPEHAAPIARLTTKLAQALGDRAILRVQLPLLAPDESEPEPDLAVVPPGDYDTVHPDRAWLLVEVARSSPEYDRLTKGALYAQMGVEDYWIVDVDAQLVEVHREPLGSRYARVTPHRRGEEIALVALPDVKIAVTDVLRAPR